MFSPVKADDSVVPYLAETAIFAQWFHSYDTLHYARWHDGEVDMVMLGEKQKPRWAVEVKWSDRYCEKPEELRSVVSFQSPERPFGYVEDEDHDLQSGWRCYPVRTCKCILLHGRIQYHQWQKKPHGVTAIGIRGPSRGSTSIAHKGID